MHDLKSAVREELHSQEAVHRRQLLADPAHDHSRTHAARHEAANRWLGFGALLSLRSVPALTLLSLVSFFFYGLLEARPDYGLLWTGFGMGLR